jgi:hypothetical protein
MFRYLVLSGGEVNLSKCFENRTDRDNAASAAYLELVVKYRTGMQGDEVLLLDNAAEDLSVSIAEYPSKEARFSERERITLENFRKLNKAGKIPLTLEELSNKTGKSVDNLRESIDMTKVEQ